MSQQSREEKKALETAALDGKVEKQKTVFPLSHKRLENSKSRVFHSSHSFYCCCYIPESSDLKEAVWPKCDTDWEAENE